MGGMDDNASTTSNFSSVNAEELESWISQYRDSLRLMLELRMDVRLRTRIDASDVLQETFLEAVRRVDEFPGSGMKPRIWLRFLAQQQLLIAWRRHALTKSRNFRRETNVDRLSISGEALLNLILQSGTTPSQLLMKEEAAVELRNALEQLDEMDREVLTMRHYEQLSLDETAHALGISAAAASKRYYRAVKRIAALMPKG